jgi:V-type H+-transporting ATPase proteolipid subunit
MGGADGFDLQSYNMYDAEPEGSYCPKYSTFAGVMGCSASMYMCAIGAAYGTAKCGTGLAGMAVMYPSQTLKNLIPIVMASVIAIYGLVVSVLIVNGMGEAKNGKYTVFDGYIDFAAGITCGISGIASGWATAISGDLGVRTVCHQPKYFVGMILTLIFAGVMGLYGLIVALTLRTSAGSGGCFAKCHNPCCAEIAYACTVSAIQCVAA